MHRGNMEKLRSKAYAEARILVRNKILEAKSLALKDLNEAQTAQIEAVITKKDSLVQEIAEKRYARLIAGLNEKFAEKFSDDPCASKSDNKGKSKSKKRTPIVQHLKFEEEAEANSSIFKAVIKKSEDHAINLNILGEVYNRGYNAYDDTRSVSREQYAFARVNSFINRGKIYYSEDKDLADDASVITESNNTPYVRPHFSHTESDKQVGWKASNKHGRVKYFGKDFESSAKRHAGLTEVTDWEEWGRKHDETMAKFKPGTYFSTTDKHKGAGGAGYVTGHDHKKKDHVILTVSTGAGTRSKGDNPTKDISVHQDHLKKVSKSDWIQEGKMKEVDDDLKNLDNGNFKKKYGNHKDHFRVALNAPVKEEVDDLEEVSKGLMQRYLNKAGKSAEGLIDAAVNHNTAADRLRKAGASASDIIKQDSVGHAIGKKADKRFSSIDKVAKKVNEESIEEMSNDKLMAYSIKAAKEISKVTKPNRAYEKRLDGITQAGEKIYNNRKTKPTKIGEDVTSADKQPVIVPAHKDAFNHTIPAKVVLRKSNRKIIRSGNLHDGEPEEGERR